MRREKVKEFVKEHKKELLIGGAGFVIGVVLTKNRVSKFEYKTLKEMRSFGFDRNDIFGSLAGGIMETSDGANIANVFKMTSGNNVKFADYAGEIAEFYKDRNPDITGAIVFTK